MEQYPCQREQLFADASSDFQKNPEIEIESVYESRHPTHAHTPDASERRFYHKIKHANAITVLKVGTPLRGVREA
jgi:hypothetical protein